MNINRNNYEEFFLLYIDNELSVSEKNMVDIFVANNPDLGEELVMLQQSIVKPEAILFPGKETLAKPPSVTADIEEKLLLLLDNELPGKEKKQILELTVNNQSVKEEWELLQQTKLSVTDKVIFEDKPSLYKKETRVVPFAWWRMAAAAMLIGFGLWGTVSYINRNETKDPSVAGTAGVSTAKEQPGINKITDTAVTTDNMNESAAIAGKQNSSETISAAKQTTEKVPQQSLVLQKNTDKNIASAKDKEQNKTVAEDDLDNINNSSRNEKVLVNVSPETNINKPDNNVEITSSPKNEYATAASFNNTTSQEYASFEDDSDEDKPKRTKLGGFFKKVKRQFERKTKIKTGNDDEVRIANMSFAMH